MNVNVLRKTFERLPKLYRACLNNNTRKTNNCLHRLAAASQYPRVPVHPHHQSTVHFQRIAVNAPISNRHKRYMLHGESATCWMKFSLQESPTSEKPVDSPFRPRKILPLLPGRIYFSPKTRTISAELSTNTTFRENRLSALTARNTNGRKVIFSPLFHVILSLKISITL